MGQGETETEGRPIKAPEEWRPVSEQPDYEVSNLGRVRRDDHFITPYDDGAGYLSVNLCQRSRLKRRRVHRLVCIAFHGPPPTPKHDAAHWDNDRANNRATNLRWATRKENHADKVRHGTMSRGEKHPNVIFTEAEALRAFALIKQGKGCTEIARMMTFETGKPVTRGMVKTIKAGRAWAWLCNDLTMEGTTACQQG